MALLGLLLVASWLFGGLVRDSSWHDEGLQLLALPLLVVAVAALLRAPPRSALARVALGVMLAGFAAVALQMIPLPSALWMASTPRAELARDLASAGISSFPMRWTLSPYATEAALWRMLPPLAAFLGGLVAARRFRRVLLLGIVLLAVANLGLAMQQDGLAYDSRLRLYPVMDGVPMFGGLFVNQNHHATALVLAMTLALCLAIDAWRRRVPGSRKRELLAIVCVGLGALCLFALPLTHSRAGMALAAPALAGCVLLTGGVRLDAISRRPWLLAAAAGIAIFVAGLSLHWLAAAPGADPRFIIADAAFRRGLQYLPWGSGAGSFTPIFETQLPKALWIPNFVNHAHNEYAQWWLLGGLPAVAVVGAGLMVFVLAGMRLLRLRGRRSTAVLAAGCWVAITVALVHSWVDFPLGTPALAVTVALLAGILFASLDGLAEAPVGSAEEPSRGRSAGRAK